MTFTEAREAFLAGRRIRHEEMPDGNWIMLYRRGFGTDLPIIFDENGCLSGKEIDFIAMFWSALGDDDDEWVTEAQP